MTANKNKLSKWLSIGIAILVLTSVVSGCKAPVQTGSISGRVVEEITGQGVEGATIRILEADLGCQSDPSGLFTMKDIPAGTQRLQFSKQGFISVTTMTEVEAGEVCELGDIPLLRVELSIADITEVSRQDFQKELVRDDELRSLFDASKEAGFELAVPPMELTFEDGTGGVVAILTPTIGEGQIQVLVKSPAYAEGPYLLQVEESKLCLLSSTGPLLELTDEAISLFSGGVLEFTIPLETQVTTSLSVFKQSWCLSTKGLPFSLAKGTVALLYTGVKDSLLLQTPPPQSPSNPDKTGFGSEADKERFHREIVKYVTERGYGLGYLEKRMKEAKELPSPPVEGLPGKALDLKQLWDTIKLVFSMNKVHKVWSEGIKQAAKKMKSDLENEKNKLQEDKQSLEIEKASLPAETQKLQKDKQQLVGKGGKLQEDKSKLAGKKSELEAKMTKLEKERSELEEKKSELKKEYSNLDAERSKLEEEKWDLKVEKATLTDEKATAKQELSRLKQEKSNLETEKPQLQREEEDVNEQLKKELAKQEPNITLINALIARLNAIAARLKKIDELIPEYDKLIGGIDKRIQEIDKRLPEIDARRGAIDKRTGAINDRCVEIYSLELPAIYSRLSDIKFETLGVPYDILSLEQQIAHINQELVKINQRLQQINGQLQRVAPRTAEIDRRLAEIAKRIAERVPQIDKTLAHLNGKLKRLGDP